MGRDQQKTLQVMSYNIKYATEEDGEDSWSQRKDRLIALLKKYEPDVFGVQEARLEQLRFIKEELDHYAYMGTGRDGGDEGLFNAIFFDCRNFEVSNDHTFWLSETPNEPSKGWDASFRRTCTFALVNRINSRDKFWLFNTHFDHQGEEAMEKSAEMIIEKMRIVNDEKFPAILVGDFNLEADSGPITFLSEQLADSKKTAREIAPGPDETFNAYEYDEPPIARIDYIFTDSKIEVLKYAVLTDSQEEHYPSDHFPVLTEIKFK